MRLHTNAFDLIRLAAAGMVLWSHQHLTDGSGTIGIEVFRTDTGGFGVLIFFVISGYLNTLSVTRHRAILPFLVSRGLRIYPPLIACVAFSVLVGACFTPDIRTYFDYRLLSLICKDITLFTGTIAGVSHPVFAGSVLPNTLNGSLWTLPYELKMYVVLAVAFATFRFNSAVALAAAVCGLLALGFTALDTFWLQFSALFLAGSFLAVLQKIANLAVAIFTVLLLCCLFAAVGQHFFAWHLLLVAAVIGLGSMTLPSWLRPPLDLSYAIYLYAFPVQQVSTMVTKNFWIGLSFSITVSSLLALLSVLFIEQPAQRLAPGLRRWLQERSRAMLSKWSVLSPERIGPPVRPSP